MGIKAVHPTHSLMCKIWELVKDVYGGELTVKDKTVTYLPPTSGQLADGMNKPGDSEGKQAYLAYLLRAVCPDLYRKAVETIVGTMHRKPAVIELPDAMSSLIDSATANGESALMVLRKINEAQVTTGRIGVLGDLVPSSLRVNDVVPILSLYEECAIRNWHASGYVEGVANMDMIILDESGHKMNMDTYEWEKEERYRMLVRSDLTEVPEYNPEGRFYGTASMGPEGTLSGANGVFPNRMGKRLEKIPFSFINTIDIVPEPCQPPLLGLALLVLTIYRGEADYRHSLFMQGQDTLVRIGIQHDPDATEKPVRTGAGARIDVPVNGDAKYIGVNSEGLAEQRSSLENDYKRAGHEAQQLNDTGGTNQKEAAESLRRRSSAQSATLPQIALAGAAGLEDVFRSMAPWFGVPMDSEEIGVTPNLDFSDDEFDGKTLVELLTAKTLGGKISDETIHEWMQEQGVSKHSYEEELERLNNEEPSITDVIE